MYIAPYNVLERRMGSYLLSGPGRHRFMPRRPDRRQLGQDAIDTGNLPLAPINVNETLSPLTPAADTGMIAAGTRLAPPGQNYSPALTAYFNATPAQAAQMIANSSPGALVTAPAKPSGISTNLLLLAAAGVAAFMVIGGGGKKRRR